MWVIHLPGPDLDPAHILRIVPEPPRHPARPGPRRFRMTVQSARFARSCVLALAGLALVGSVAFFGAKASATSVFRGPPAAPVIAVVDLDAVLQGLNEKKEREAALQATLKELQNRVSGLGEDAKNEQAKLEQAPPADKPALAKALREKIIRAEFEKQYSEKLLGETSGEVIRDIYLKIDAATERLAKQNGYQLVLASDEKNPIPERGATGDILRAIAGKRMLYVDPSLDITQEVIALMNNEYAAKK